MPLRDHFRSPLDDVHSWDELHGMWPATIVRALIEVLPEPYYAAPGAFTSARCLKSMSAPIANAGQHRPVPTVAAGQPWPRMRRQSLQ